MTTPSQPQYSMPAPKGASGAYIRAADGIVAIGALIMFLFSFAPFISAPGGFHQNAWTFERPVPLFIVFAAILLLATAFIDTWWKRDEQKVGLNRHHVQVGLARQEWSELRLGRHLHADRRARRDRRCDHEPPQPAAGPAVPAVVRFAGSSGRLPAGAAGLRPAAGLRAAGRPAAGTADRLSPKHTRSGGSPGGAAASVFPPLTTPVDHVVSCTLDGVLSS